MNIFSGTYRDNGLVPEQKVLIKYSICNDAICLPDLISSPTFPLFFSCLLIIAHMSIHQYIWKMSSIMSNVLKM